jgi:hypothetical protein
VAATAALNTALACTFVWSELLGPASQRTLWLLVGAMWAAAAGHAWWWCRRRTVRESAEPAEDTFEQATQRYLKGDWFEAERILANLVRWNSRDVDARLLLATLFRRRQRFAEAAAQLDFLECCEAAVKWEWEIRRERKLLERAISQAAEASREKMMNQPEATVAESAEAAIASPDGCGNKPVALPEQTRAA